MYQEIKNLALYISEHEDDSFLDVWNGFVKEFHPNRKIIPTLLATGMQLKKLDKDMITEVPEPSYKYRFGKEMVREENIGKNDI